jgi:hypothetical protein
MLRYYRTETDRCSDRSRAKRFELLVIVCDAAWVIKRNSRGSLTVETLPMERFSERCFDLFFLVLERVK